MVELPKPLELPWADLMRQTEWAIAVSHDRHTHAYVSEAFARMHGGTAADFVGGTVADLYPPEERVRLRGVVARLERGEHVIFETRHLRRDGTSFPVSVDATTWNAPAGPRSVIVHLRDLSERERADDLQRMLSQLLDATLHEIYVLDPDVMRFVHASAGALRNLGYTLEELRTLSPLDLSVDADHARVRENVRALLEDRRVTPTFSTSIRRKDGTVYPMLLRLQRTVYEGKPAVLGVAIDETERVEAERMLNEKEGLYRRLASNSRDAIFRCKLDEARFEYWSPAALDVLGFAPEEILDDPSRIRDRLGPEGKALLSQAKGRVAMEGERATFETSYAHPSGESKWLLVRMTLARDASGRGVAVEGGMTDITKRKRAEDEVRALNQDLEVRVRERTRALEEANTALDAFARAVSHDIRAPLRSVTGFTAVLLEEASGSLNAEAKSAAAHILAASQRAERLTDELLAFCRVDHRPVRRGRCDLGAFARSAADDLAERTRRRVTLTVADDLMADADPELADLALRSLLDNAWKFTRSCPDPRMEVGVTLIDGERVFFVRDNGIGFDMTKVDRVFAPLERLHGVEEYEGAGLGVPMAKRIIERHGGRLWAVAKPNEGATFYFTFSTLSPAPSKGD